MTSWNGSALARNPPVCDLRSGVTFEPAPRLSLDALGAERTLFAADYPYEVAADAVKFIDEVKITEEERAKIYCDNARRVFRLD